MLVRRVASDIALDPQGRAGTVTHTARDGSDPQVVEALRIISNAAPASLAALMPAAAAEKLTKGYAKRTSSISLFALTLGLSKPPREFGISAYSTQLLPREMQRLSDYAQGAALMANEPGERMPPLSIVDYAAIDSRHSRAAPCVADLRPRPAVELGTVRTRMPIAANADGGRTPSSIISIRSIPGWRRAWVASSFNTALSVRQYLNAPGGAVYGFAPTPPSAFWRSPAGSPRTAVSGLYLASAYAGFGGYTGVVQAAGACADMILREG